METCNSCRSYLLPYACYAYIQPLPSPPSPPSLPHLLHVIVPLQHHPPQVLDVLKDGGREKGEGGREDRVSAWVVCDAGLCLGAGRRGGGREGGCLYGQPDHNTGGHDQRGSLRTFLALPSCIVSLPSLPPALLPPSLPPSL